MGSPLGSSDFETSAPGTVTTGSTMSGLVDQTQSNVTSALQTQVQGSSAWNSASGSFFSTILGGFTSAVNLVTADIDNFLASICTAITGATGGFINLSSWATSLQNAANSALSGVSTIATGVTTNIAGATSSSSPSAVGGAVAVLNSTVQTSSQAPSEQIFTANGTWTMPAGCVTVEVHCIAGGAGGPRPNAVNATSPITGGAIGNYQHYVFQASAIASTVPITIGTAGTGATSDNTLGTSGTATSFGTYLTAAGGNANGVVGAGNWNPGSASNTGGSSGYTGNGYAGAAGSNGTWTNGGTGGANGGNGNGGTGSNGTSPPPGLIGVGSSGGGGGGCSGIGSQAGAGGNGGYPGGAGGAGGVVANVGFDGDGGAGSAGYCVVIAGF